MRPHARLAAIPLLWWALACGPTLAGAKEDFTSGRVPDAKDKLVALEDKSRGWSATERAEYALYRGLVHHSLGDRDAAVRWLSEAKAMETARPKTLSEGDLVRLNLALDAIGASR